MANGKAAHAQVAPQMNHHEEDPAVEAPTLSITAVHQALADHAFTGATQQGLGPEMWGVSLEQLEELARDPRCRQKAYHDDGWAGMRAVRGSGSTTRHLVRAVVVPETAGSGLGYALKKNKGAPLKARTVVSHAWDEEYDDFLKLLKSSGAPGPYWVCATALYQPEDHSGLTIADQLGSKVLSGPVATALKHAEAMAVIITQHCALYSRMWCIFEMFIAEQLGVPVHCGARFSHHEAWGHLESDLISACQLPIHCQSARCGGPAKQINEDEHGIRQLIEALPGSYDFINRAVETSRLRSLEKFAAQGGLYQTFAEPVIQKVYTRLELLAAPTN